MTVGQLIEWLMDHADMDKQVMTINPNEEGGCCYEAVTAEDLEFMNDRESRKFIYL